MEINRGNYEVYFLDYFENRLGPTQVAELMVFLEENPDLQNEFDQFESISLESGEGVNFANKNQLKKKDYKTFASIDAWNYEEQMVAYLEGDLDENDKAAIKGFIRANPDAALELNLFKKTFLTPPDIQFADKEDLKQAGKRIVLWPIGLVAAAAIVLFFGLRLFFSSEQLVPVGRLQSVQNNPLTELPQNPVNPQRIEMRGFFVNHQIVALQAEKPEIFAKEEPIARIAELNNEFTLQANAGVLSNLNQRSDFDQMELAFEPVKEKSFAGRFLGNLLRKSLGNPQPQNKSLIEYTVEGYNLMADRDVEVDKVYDKDGQLIGYDVNGGFIAFNQRGKE